MIPAIPLPAAPPVQQRTDDAATQGEAAEKSTLFSSLLDDEVPDDPDIPEGEVETKAADDPVEDGTPKAPLDTPEPVDPTLGELLSVSRPRTAEDLAGRSPRSEAAQPVQRDGVPTASTQTPPTPAVEQADAVKVAPLATDKSTVPAPSAREDARPDAPRAGPPEESRQQTPVTLTPAAAKSADAPEPTTRQSTLPDAAVGTDRNIGQKAPPPSLPQKTDRALATPSAELPVETSLEAKVGGTDPKQQMASTMGQVIVEHRAAKVAAREIEPRKSELAQLAPAPVTSAPLAETVDLSAPKAFSPNEAGPVTARDTAEALAKLDPASPAFERPVPSTLHTVSSQTPAASADQARQIAQQMATALPSTVPGTTEITLQPEELGRVRMTLTVQDGALTLIIQADRPDTSDLMRRNIDQLAQVYRQMGFDTPSFNFTGSPQQDAAPEDPSAPNLGEDETITDLPDAVTTSTLPSDPQGRLDLRI